MSKAQSQSWGSPDKSSQLISEINLLRFLQEPQIADDDLTLPKIRVGICAMDKKARSRPMNAIVDRMLAFGEFEIFVFGDDCILNRPIQEWPTCECLLSWHSDGFPLVKVKLETCFQRLVVHHHFYT